MVLTSLYTGQLLYLSKDKHGDRSQGNLRNIDFNEVPRCQSVPGHKLSIKKKKKRKKKRSPSCSQDLQVSGTGDSLSMSFIVGEHLGPLLSVN